MGYPRAQVIKSFFGINDKIFDVPHLTLQQKEYDLIYVGHFDGHKNHAPLIDALALLNKDLKVLFIGLDNGLQQQLMERARTKGLRNVVFTTEPDERKVWDYYTRSKLFVSPSLYEGFGMPTIEALALGLPVAVSDIPVFREVGVDLVSYFDPRDPHVIAGVIGRLLEDPTPPDQRRVRRHLSQFLWSAIYEKFINDVQRLAPEFTATQRFASELAEKPSSTLR